MMSRSHSNRHAGFARERARTSQQRSPARVHLVGAIVLLALLIGGGTDKSITSDMVLTVIALPVLWMAVWLFPSGRHPWPVNAFIAAIVIFFLLQLFPAFGMAGRLSLITIDTGRTLDSFLVTVTMLAFFYVTSLMTEPQKRTVVHYVLLGVLLSLVLSFAQFAAGNVVFKPVFLPHPLNAGFFENANHLAAAFYVATPLIIFISWRHGFTWLPLLLLSGLVLFQFVVGSRAGVILIIAATAMMYASLFRSRVLKAMIAMAAVVAAAATISLYISEFAGDLAGGASRSTFALTTLTAIGDTLPWGTGMGTFQLVYPRYESLVDLPTTYANHAHNDWLELLLEGGIPLLLLVLCYAALVGWRLASRPMSELQTAALIAVGLLLVHSLIDYPLRTLALALVFAVLNGFLLAPEPEDNERTRQGGARRQSRSRGRAR